MSAAAPYDNPGPGNTCARCGLRYWDGTGYIVRVAGDRASEAVYRHVCPDCVDADYQRRALAAQGGNTA